MLRRRVKMNMKRRLGAIETKLLSDPTLAPTPSDMGAWASYKGILDHCDSYRLAQGTVNRVGRLLEARA
jgi:hypothetical protein